MLAEQLSFLVWGVSLCSSFAARFFFQPAIIMKVSPWLYYGAVFAGTALLVRNFVACGRPVPKELLAKSMLGKVAVITGAAGGLGLVHAAQLYSQGCTVVVACRSLKRNEEAAEGIKKLAATNLHSNKPGEIVTKWPLDLEDLNSARTFAESFLKSGLGLDLFVMNGGLADLAGVKYAKGNKNLDHSFTINVLSHLLITERWEEKMRACNTRCVHLSSYAHTLLRPDATPDQVAQAILQSTDSSSMKAISNMGEPWPAYSLGKLVNYYHASYLVSRGIDAVALHPGICSTAFGDDMFPGAWVGSYIIPFVMAKLLAEGTTTQIFASLCDSSVIAPRDVVPAPVSSKSGGVKISKMATYMCDTAVANEQLSKIAANPEAVAKAMQACLDVLKREGF